MPKQKESRKIGRALEIIRRAKLNHARATGNPYGERKPTPVKTQEIATATKPKEKEATSGLTRSQIVKKAWKNRKRTMVRKRQRGVAK